MHSLEYIPPLRQNKSKMSLGLIKYWLKEKQTTTIRGAPNCFTLALNHKKKNIFTSKQMYLWTRLVPTHATFCCCCYQGIEIYNNMKTICKHDVTVQSVQAWNNLPSSAESLNEPKIFTNVEYFAFNGLATWQSFQPALDTWSRTVLWHVLPVTLSTISFVYFT